MSVQERDMISSKSMMRRREQQQTILAHRSFYVTDDGSGGVVHELDADLLLRVAHISVLASHIFMSCSMCYTHSDTSSGSSSSENTGDLCQFHGHLLSILRIAFSVLLRCCRCLHSHHICCFPVDSKSGLREKACMNPLLSARS